MSKFKPSQVGDKVYDILLGEWGKIVQIVDLGRNGDYPIKVYFSSSDMTISYTFDGLESILDKLPRLYWNEVHLPTMEEDKRPFNLVEFLKSNLEVKEFEYSKYNYFFGYEVEKKLWYIDCMCCKKLPNTTYFIEIPIHVIQELNDRNISFEELEEALNKLY